ncbi:U3 small nucleolar RNA-associated protein 14 homolog A [Sphaeramia orbicularis]|uniref:U3 small nucleolar RNA-associated protein 14 homolog A-like n=1 Tax=Sphaeramia orbicularis TaxID=375764 RepID=A0A672ZY65_9TELE|nr:U3 small nucleolar RNA-associated protein 14 homolog A-like [Sphaeramia orbicularis]
MAKVSKKQAIKKVKKTKKKSDSAEETLAAVPTVAYDEEEEEEEEDLNGNFSGEEDEEDERRRQKLLEAISSLGGNRRKRLGERSEAAVQMSEFGVSVDGEGRKIQLSELIPKSAPVKTQKQLKTLQASTRTVDSPLSKQETERIQRDLAFQKTAEEVTRWKSLIRQNERAEQLVFPLNQEPSGPRPVDRVALGWMAQTPLEQEVFAVLTANKQPVHDPLLTPEEEASVKAMSLGEAKIRRAELQKARALQSYYEARARRDRKIKSKKYHKVQNKAKRKDLLKQFDHMVQTDPAAALEELKKMEVARMQERMSLKHQNSSKWARSKAIMAKYDQDARNAMQQQLDINKELTQKVVTALNDDQEEEEQEEEVMPECINDAEEADAANPWMRGRLSQDPEDNEKTEDLTVEVENKGGEEEEEEEEEEEGEEEALLRKFDSRRKQRRAEEEEAAAAAAVESAEEEHKDDDEELTEFTNLLRRRQQEEEQTKVETGNPAPLLEEGLMRVRTLEEVEQLGQDPGSEENPVAADPEPALPPTEPPPETRKASKSKKRKRGIELQEVLTKQTKVIAVPLAPTAEDVEDGGAEELDQRGLIQEAFAGDDVVSDFLKDKRKQEEAGRPKVVDLTLPGWGEWGGTGIQPSRKKRRRFRVKPNPPPYRKDKNLPSVIISEQRNSAISLHRVSALPFPFENHAQFESTIRCPLGRTWNSERTVQKVTRPRVVTTLGAIIEPMSREELLKDQTKGDSGEKSNTNPVKEKNTHHKHKAGNKQKQKKK